jgi:hypothetical protein
MTNISKEGWIGIGAAIVIVVIGVGSKLFGKKNSEMPELVVPGDNKNLLTEFDKIIGGSKNSKKRNKNHKHKTKKRR